MIEKLKREPEVRSDGAILGVRTPDCSELTDKINELIDIIEELDDAITATMDSVNIHEKQIDELQMKLEPEKCEPAENIYTKTCRMDKEFAEEELDRTRKALDKAIWWLNEIVKNHRFTPISTAEKALAEINEIKGGK